MRKGQVSDWSLNQYNLLHVIWRGVEHCPETIVTLKDT